MRRLEGKWNTVFILISAVMLLFHIICNTIYLPSTVLFVSFHLICICVLVFLLFPAIPGRSPINRPSVFDILFSLISIAFGYYAVAGYMRIEYVSASASGVDLLMGASSLVIVVTTRESVKPLCEKAPGKIGKNG